MRILGWMHRKFRQNTAVLVKDFNSRPCPEEYKPAISTVTSNKDDYFKLYLKPFSGSDDNTKEGEEETLSDLFTQWNQGLLAIGTLGSDTCEPLSSFINEPEETSLGLFEKMALKEIGKDEVLGEGLISNPLDFTNEEEHHPTIQIKDMLVDALGSEAEEDVNASVKNEQRATLGELFSKNKISDDAMHSENKSGKTAHLVKKILKLRNSSSKSFGNSGHVAPENKIHKLFQKFNRKVHPSECCITATTIERSANKAEIKPAKGIESVSTEDSVIHIDQDTGKEKFWRYKGQVNHREDSAVSASDSNGNREHWIRTDADYLVLEL